MCTCRYIQLQICNLSLSFLEIIPLQTSICLNQHRQINISYFRREIIFYSLLGRLSEYLMRLVRTIKAVLRKYDAFSLAIVSRKASYHSPRVNALILRSRPCTFCTFLLCDLQVSQQCIDNLFNAFFFSGSTKELIGISTFTFSYLYCIRKIIACYDCLDSLTGGDY